jgi:ATP:ADP antiporter, AAA family
MIETQEFSKLRRMIFPIHGWELPKFIPMAIMLFGTLFNFTLLRNIKDSLINTAPESGSEVITFLKIYGVMPMTILAMLLYVKLRRNHSFERTYLTIVTIFICFFALFNFVLYPYQDFLHPDPAYIAHLKLEYHRLQWLFPIWGYWTYSLFYVFAELWGTFCLSVLFWQFANDIVTTNDSKRFYPLLILSGNIAVVCIGIVMYNLSFLSAAEIIDDGMDIVIVTGMIMMFAFYWLNRRVLIDPKFLPPGEQDSKKRRLKLGLMDSLRQVFHSSYIGYIAILLLSYGIIINCLEVTWKSKLRMMFPTQESYLNYMSIYTMITGCTSIVLIFVSKGIIQRFGWLACAIITPLVLLGTSLVFFSYLTFGDFTNIREPLEMIAMSPLMLICWFGGMGILFSKSSKYSFFDPTKEMSFIPLDPELRSTGKATADGVGGRLGKSGGGFLQSSLLFITGGSQIDIIPYLWIIIIVLGLFWISSVIKLSKLYNTLVAKRESEAVLAADAAALSSNPFVAIKDA